MLFLIIKIAWSGFSNYFSLLPSLSPFTKRSCTQQDGRAKYKWDVCLDEAGLKTQLTEWTKATGFLISLCLMPGMFLLQIQSPWKQNFSLSMPYLWWSKKLLFGRDFSIFFVDGLRMMNTSGTSRFLLSPLKCNKFLLCNIQCSPLKQRLHFSIGF